MPATLALRKRASQVSLDGDFEQRFAQLAYTYVQDRSPRLMDYVVGFQLVDRNSEGDRAVAVFGAKAGDAWMYVPVFFCEGKVRGQQLLWLKQSRTFVPNKENWVAAVIAQRPYTLGDPGPDPLRNNPMQPNFRRVVRPWEGIGKTAGLAEWSLPFGKLYAQAMLAEVKAADGGTDLVRALTRAGLGPQFYDQVYCRYPWAKLAFDKWYGNDAACALKAGPVGTKLALCNPFRAKRAASQLRVFTLAHNFDDVLDLTDAEKEQLLDDRVLVRDARPDEAVSKVRYAEAEFSTASPSRSGLYEVLTPSGGTRACVVLSAPQAHQRYNSLLVIPRDEPDKAVYSRSSEVYALNESDTIDPPGEGFKTWFDGLADASPRAGQAYVAVGPDGSCSTVFRVLDSVGDDCYRVSIEPPLPRDQTDGHVRAGLSIMVLPTSFVQLGGTGLTLTSVGDRLYVPAGFKLASLGDAFPYSKEIAFGRPEDVQRAAAKQANFTLFARGHRVHFHVQGGRWDGTAKEAAARLVYQFGLRADAAGEVVKTAQARPNRPVALAIKYAHNFGPAPGPSIPYFPEPQTYGETFGETSATVNPQLEESVPSVGPEYPPGDPFYRPDAGAMNVARKAVDSGQKDVFDVSAFSAMLRRRLDDTDLGDQVRALDGLGNRIFQLYARWDEYRERYGKDDLPEFEAGLDDTFESLGDLTLFMQKKDVRGVPGLRAVSPDNDSPSVDDSDSL